MTGARSFIDILFILLLGLLVMLTRSVEIGAVDTELLRVGAGGVSAVRVDETQLVVIGARSLTLDGVSHASADALDGTLRPAAPVLLVTTDADVTFRRVMSVWSHLREAGRDVRLGALPASIPKDEGP